jgi:hypothetical protein
MRNPSRMSTGYLVRRNPIRARLKLMKPPATCVRLLTHPRYYFARGVGQRRVVVVMEPPKSGKATMLPDTSRFASTVAVCVRAGWTGRIPCAAAVAVEVAHVLARARAASGLAPDEQVIEALRRTATEEALAGGVLARGARTGVRRTRIPLAAARGRSRSALGLDRILSHPDPRLTVRDGQDPVQVSMTTSPYTPRHAGVESVM